MNRDLAQTVRERAGERCEYCRIPQSALQLRFQVDHIIAEQHGGEAVLGNISLSRVLTAIAIKVLISPALINSLVNSSVYFIRRTDDWIEHFQFVEALLVGKTPIGRATVQVLAMNADELLRFRMTLLQAGVPLVEKSA